MRKRLIFLFFAVLFTFMALCIVNRPLRAENFTLKALLAWPKGTLEDKAFTIFRDTVDRKVAEKYRGELKIQFIGGPEAVKTQDQVEALQSGMVDMVSTCSSFYASVLPEADAKKLSMFSPPEERTNGILAYMNDIHEKRIGAHVLATVGLGVKFHLYLKKLINTADLNGLSIRTSPVHMPVIKGLGGNPVVLPPTEIYVALERSVVDGFCWPTIGVRDWGWQRQVKYIVKPGFFIVDDPILVNLKTWKKLPRKLQDLLIEAGIEAEKKVYADYQDLEKNEYLLLEKEGVKIIDLPVSEKERFLKVAYGEGWKVILEKCPKAGPELKKLLTTGKK